MDQSNGIYVFERGCFGDIELMQRGLKGMSKLYSFLKKQYGPNDLKSINHIDAEMTSGRGRKLVIAKRVIVSKKEAITLAFSAENFYISQHSKNRLAKIDKPSMMDCILRGPKNYRVPVVNADGGKCFVLITL